MTIYTHKDLNTRLTWLYLAGFFVFVMGVGWVFSRAMNNPAILYGAVVFAVLMNIASYWWSDKIILGMAGAKEVGRENAREIYRIVENLCITAGLPVPRIYIINDPSPNAFATGRDPEHAVVAMTTGILAKLNKQELEGVIAHELSHIGNRDILISAVLTVLVGFVVILSDFFWRWSIFGRSDDEDKGSSQIRLIITVGAIVLAILAPIFAQLMQLAISRKREFLADADGVLLTRYPEGLASALEKISSDNNVLENAGEATAHMYIVNPLKGHKAAGFISKLFSTHPPIEERIRRLRESAV